MKLNERGEAITLTLVVFSVLVGLVGVWFGQSKYAKVVGLGGSEGQKTRQISTTKIESKPIFVIGQDGKQYVLQATKSESSTLDTSEEPKMTLWQRLMMLPKFITLLGILGIIFPPLGLLLLRMLFMLKGNLKQIVGGVEEGMKKLDGKPELQLLKDELSKRYDSSTKLLVSKMKRKIN